MAKKYYAVRKGRTSGIFLTWNECKGQIDGFSGAEYKSFPTIEQAEEYINLPDFVGEKQNKKEEPKPLKKGEIPYKENTAIAYTDGSYNIKTHEFSCGAVLFYEGKKIEFSQKYDDPSLADMRNVAGEIMGAVSVIEYCVGEGIENLEIHHDYEGVGKWALGLWKANKEGTKAYAQLCRDVKSRLNITFVHVKGHSGDVYNDEADVLAKRALGL